MRLPVLSPAELTDEQKPLYKDMRAGIQSHFKGFLNVRSDGALLGPWNPWIREPKFGRTVWELVKTIVAQPSLPAAVREVAILVTGAHFRSAYELYAHVLVAEQRGLSEACNHCCGTAAFRSYPPRSGRIRLRFSVG